MPKFGSLLYNLNHNDKNDNLIDIAGEMGDRGKDR